MNMLIHRIFYSPHLPFIFTIVQLQPITWSERTYLYPRQITCNAVLENNSSTSPASIHPPTNSFHSKFHLQ